MPSPLALPRLLKLWHRVSVVRLRGLLGSWLERWSPLALRIGLEIGVCLFLLSLADHQVLRTEVVPGAADELALAWLTAEFWLAYRARLRGDPPRSETPWLRRVLLGWSRSGLAVFTLVAIAVWIAAATHHDELWLLDEWLCLQLALSGGLSWWEKRPGGPAQSL